MTKLFTISEVASAIGIKPYTINYHLRVGNIVLPKQVVVGGKRCFTEGDIMAISDHFNTKKSKKEIL